MIMNAGLRELHPGWSVGFATPPAMLGAPAHLSCYALGQCFAIDDTVK
jgi:hypothetical protein